MFKQLKKLHKDSQGFTLVELMIVVAIIGILAAIAIPQFAAYRTRSYNAAAKAVAHNAVGTEADLQSELGAYGVSEAANATLVVALVGYGIVDTNVTAGDTALAMGATATTGGGRIIGTNPGTGKIFAVSLGYGANMEASIAVDANSASYHVIARAFNGDTQYAIDSDVTNIVYSASNPAWPGVAMVAADIAEPIAAISDATDDFAGGLAAAAASALDPTWQPVR